MAYRAGSSHTILALPIHLAVATLTIIPRLIAFVTTIRAAVLAPSPILPGGDEARTSGLTSELTLASAMDLRAVHGNMDPSVPWRVCRTAVQFTEPDPSARLSKFDIGADHRPHHCH